LADGEREGPAAQGIPAPAGAAAMDNVRRCPGDLPRRAADVDNPGVALSDQPRSSYIHFQPKENTMKQVASSASRRRFFRITAVGLAAAPFASALMSGSAQAADAVKESDPTATALGYVVDATKSTKRTDKAATCANCSLFSGKAGAADGPCTIFQGKLVTAKGWCSAWVKKA
jgi:hypothetical protein